MFFIVTFIVLSVSMLIGYSAATWTPVVFFHVVPVVGMVIIINEIIRIWEEKGKFWRLSRMFFICLIGSSIFSFCGYLDHWYKTGTMPQGWSSTPFPEAVGKILIWTIIVIAVGSLCCFISDKVIDHLNRKKRDIKIRNSQYL